MFDSIRMRLTLWYLSVLASLIIGFTVVVYLLVAQNLSRTIDNNLAEVGRSIETDLRKEEADIAAERLIPMEPADEESDEEKNTLVQPAEVPLTIEAAIEEELTDLRSRDYGFIVLDGNGRMIASTVTNPRLEDESKNLAADVSFADVRVENESFRVHQMRLNLDGKPFQLLVIRPLREQGEFLAGLRRIFFAAVPITLILAGLGGYFLARRSLAPIVSMSSQAANIGSSNLNERLPVKNENDELGGLARTFNDLLSRLESSFQQQKQFMADASHELRTPLAIVRGESEVALSKKDRAAIDYRQSLAIVHDESIRLSTIVEDLFILSRADSGQLKPRLAAVYLDEILAECVRVVETLARKRKIKLDVSLIAEMPLDGDEALLHRLFLNLLDNAIKYSREEGIVAIQAQHEGENYCVSIGDNGEGIAAEDRAKIFDRFYRVDKSRTRDNTNGANGVGLGLSIAAWIAQVHGGTVTLQKSDQSGSTFLVTFPVLS